jgi:hypothetical protein
MRKRKGGEAEGRKFKDRTTAEPPVPSNGLSSPPNVVSFVVANSFLLCLLQLIRCVVYRVIYRFIYGVVYRVIYRFIYGDVYRVFLSCQFQQSVCLLIAASTVWCLWHDFVVTPLFIVALTLRVVYLARHFFNATTIRGFVV